MVAQRIARLRPQAQPSNSDHAEFVICDHTNDLTYVRLRFEFVYLAIILDVFTRNIRGWHLSKSLDLRLSQVALE